MWQKGKKRIATNRIKHRCTDNTDQHATVDHLFLIRGNNNFFQPCLTPEEVVVVAVRGLKLAALGLKTDGPAGGPTALLPPASLPLEEEGAAPFGRRNGRRA